MCAGWEVEEEGLERYKGLSRREVLERCDVLCALEKPRWEVFDREGEGLKESRRVIIPSPKMRLKPPKRIKREKKGED